MPRSGKGFVWFALNGKTDYCKLSRLLAKSIRDSGTAGNIAVITDAAGKLRLDKDANIDHVITIDVPRSQDDNNFAPEYSVFELSPFVHTIKLEADMLVTQDISWWWHHLCQHDLVFSHDCLEYTEEPVVDRIHRKLFLRNNLPNIYNGLSYFRFSQKAKDFYSLCKQIHAGWDDVKNDMLKNCTDEHGSTDVVYALAAKLLDPLAKETISYDFFRMIHYKNHLNNTEDKTDIITKHSPFWDSQKLIVGQHAITKPIHYHHKDFVERIHDGR